MFKQSVGKKFDGTTVDMMNKILELVVFTQDLLVTQYEKP